MLPQPKYTGGVPADRNSAKAALLSEPNTNPFDLSFINSSDRARSRSRVFENSTLAALVQTIDEGERHAFHWKDLLVRPRKTDSVMQASHLETECCRSMAGPFFYYRS